MKFDPVNLDWVDSHKLFASAVVPRPIAFVSTIGEDGVYNVAPFSFFTALTTKPALIGFCNTWTREGRKKDTLRNIEFTKEFVINIIDETLAEPMNQASYPYPSDVDEFKEAGLTPVKADLVKAPMVAESPVSMECRLVQVLELGEAPRKTSFTIGEVLRVHVKDGLYVNKEIRISKLRAIGRLGEDLYCRTTDTFELKRPYVLG